YPGKPLPLAVSPSSKPSSEAPAEFADRTAKLKKFIEGLSKFGEGQSYESAHAKLALRAIEVIAERQALGQEKEIDPLPEPAGTAAEKAYVDAASKLYDGLVKVIAGYEASTDARKQ